MKNDDSLKMRMPLALKQQLEEVARVEGRTLADVVRRLVTEALAARKAEK